MSTTRNAVTAEPTNGSATIRARVGASAIDKVTRLFSAGLADIFTETLQNSRRGGANRVAATIEQDGDGTRVTLADDGAGIADPAILLTFGESNRNAGIAEAEDPAGFGLLALSRGGCTLRWRVPGGDPSPGYRLVLEPAHFLGRDAAHVVPDDSAPWPHGTAVTFEASEAPHAVRAFLETAARHYPLPVHHRRRDRRAPRLPRRRAPCGTMEGPRVRRLQGQPCGLPRPRRQLPWPDPADTPAPDRRRGRRRLVGARRHRLVPRSGASPAREKGGGGDPISGKDARSCAAFRLPRHGAGRSGPARCLDRLAQGERGRDRDARAARRAASLASPVSPIPTIGTSGPPSRAQAPTHW